MPDAGRFYHREYGDQVRYCCFLCCCLCARPVYWSWSPTLSQLKIGRNSKECTVGLEEDGRMWPSSVWRSTPPVEARVNDALLRVHNKVVTIYVLADRDWTICCLFRVWSVCDDCLRQKQYSRQGDRNIVVIGAKDLTLLRDHTYLLHQPAVPNSRRSMMVNEKPSYQR